MGRHLSLPFRLLGRLGISGRPRLSKPLRDLRRGPSIGTPSLPQLPGGVVVRARHRQTSPSARRRRRQRGAWLWPTFVAATAFDGVMGHALPLSGETQSVAGGLVMGLVLNLLAVLFCSRPLGAVLRRRRSDLPTLVAVNYGGAFAVAGGAGILLAVGLLHRSTVIALQRALQDAITRAEAFIGGPGPAAFRGNLTHLDTFTIEPGSIYRTCVPSVDGARTYCVIVRTWLPFARSVTFAGANSTPPLAK